MRRFLSAILSVIVALATNIFHRLLLAILDLVLAEVLTLIPDSRFLIPNNVFSLCLSSFSFALILYGFSALITARLITFLCRKMPSVNERGVRLWNLFTVGLSLFALLGTENIDLFAAYSCIAGGFLPSYLFLRYRPVASSAHHDRAVPDSVSDSDPELDRLLADLSANPGKHAGNSSISSLPVRRIGSHEKK